jgi:hypothetical protein
LNTQEDTFINPFDREELKAKFDRRDDSILVMTLNTWAFEVTDILAVWKTGSKRGVSSRRFYLNMKIFLRNTEPPFQGYNLCQSVANSLEAMEMMD